MQRHNFDRVALLIAALSLAGFIALAVGDIVTTSPTSDETTHLGAGYSYLTTGDFRMNIEHPPLLKQFAALPLLAMDIRQPHSNEQWTKALTDLNAEWEFAHQLFYSVRGADPHNLPTTVRYSRADFVNDAEAIFTRARLMMLLLGVALGILIYLWSRSVWGPFGATISVLLFSFDPNFIAHSGLVTTDVGVSMLMFGTIYFFWRCCERFTWPSAAGFVLFFALAQIAKYSAVLLVPMLLLIAAYRWRQAAVIIALTAAAGLASVLAIWADYGFHRDIAREGIDEAADLRMTLDRMYAVKSLLDTYPLEGPPDDAIASAQKYTQIGTAGRLLLDVQRWHLLPEAYTIGLGVTAATAVSRQGYFMGRYSRSGFGEYFPATIFFKTPIPSLVLIAIGVFAAMRRKAFAWLAIPVAVYLGTSMMSAVDIGHRHILPIYPFLYVMAGGAAAKLRRPAMIIAAIALVVLSSLLVVIPPRPMWGRHLSYMNEFAGGPNEKILCDSNIDWGQDLKRLSAWLDDHKVDEPINLVYFGTADPRYYGIRYLNMEFGYPFGEGLPVGEAKIPGYFAVSVNQELGILNAKLYRDFWPRYLNGHGAREVGQAGYSIHIYRVER
jgi:dolichyl-phosphate-mannose-protein mannosyltransferase